MKKTIKRFLAVLLSLLMMMSLLPMASAEESSGMKMDLPSFGEFVTKFYKNNLAQAIALTPIMPVLYLVGIILLSIFGGTVSLPFLFGKEIIG